MSDKFIAVRDDGSVHIEDSRAAIAQALRAGRTDITFYGIQVDPDTLVPTLHGPVALSPQAPVQVRTIEAVGLDGAGTDLGQAEVEVEPPSPPEPNPVPVLTRIGPDSAYEDAPAFTLVVYGSGFNDDSEVRVDGVGYPTTLGPSGDELEAALPDAATLGVGPRAVTVFNQTPGGGASQSIDFFVEPVNPVPVLTGLNATSITAMAAGETAPVIIATGSGFMTQSKIIFAGALTLSTTYVSDTELRATLEYDQASIPGTYDITVSSQGPGGGVSAPIQLIITP